MAAPNLQPGDVCYLDYGEVPRVVHTRLVIGVVDHSAFEYMVLTPDMDHYIEELHSGNSDLAHFYPAPPGGGLPRGVPRAAVYAFAPMSAADLARWLQRGRDEAGQERVRRGRPAGVAPAGPVAAPEGGGGVGDPLVWVVASPVEGKKIGDTVVPPANMPVLGDFGLMVHTDSSGTSHTFMVKRMQQGDIPLFCEGQIMLARQAEASDGDDRMAGDDIRTMAVKYSPNGERQRSVRETIAEMVQVEIEDFPYEPRTTLEYLKGVTSVSESNYSQHLAWVQQSRIPDGSRAIYEDETLAKVLDLAISYDSLNISNLACFELICRRRQLIGEAHAYNPSAPSYQGADFWLGDKFKHGGAIVVPSLTEHVSKKLQAESQILKERRKLEEAKAKTRPTPKSGNKGQQGGADK